MDNSKGGRGSFKHIGNKAKRQGEYRKYRSDKKKDKLAKRISQAKEERGTGGAEKKAVSQVARDPESVPNLAESDETTCASQIRLAEIKTRTIENTREFNPTIISEPNTHPGLKPSCSVIEARFQAAESSKAGAARASAHADAEAETGEAIEGEEEGHAEADDERAFEDASAPPAILITTSAPSSSTSPHLASVSARSHPAERTRDFIDELLNMFPGGEYRQRAKARGASLGKIADWARKRGYNAMIVIGEGRKEPVMLTIIGLPEGPTAVFRLTSVALGKEIHGHARSTAHSPELILNNFTTALGHSVGSLLQSLFPAIPQLEGRQTLTAHNQRDFIFFRRHRYEFTIRKGEEKARLQEIGPRFTVKLRKLIAGLPKGAGGWDGVIDFNCDGTSTPHASMDMGGGRGNEETINSPPVAGIKRALGQVAEPATEFAWKVSNDAMSDCLCRTEPKSDPCSMLSI